MSAHLTSSIRPGCILTDLAELRVSMGNAANRGGQPTVVRACSLTLIVTTDESDQGRVASETLFELLREHPSRSIVLAISQSVQESSEARIVTQSWEALDTGRQIGCERIEMTVRREDWPKIESLLQELPAADLPVIFWCSLEGAMTTQAENVLDSGVESIMNLACKTIVDTQGCSTNDALYHLAKWREDRHIVADLEWTRLTHWRELIARLFDDAARRNPLSAFRNIEIAYTDETLALASLYMGAWLSAPHGATVTFKRVEGYHPGVQAITMHSSNETIVLERTSMKHMSISSSSGRQWIFNYSDRSTAALLTEELAIIERDPTFDAIFVRVRELLERHI